MGTKVLNDNINSVTETVIVTLIENLFQDVAYVDAETVRKNIGLGSDGGMDRSDRTIRVETVNYMMRHFGIIFFGLIINNNFRNEFIKAIQLEIGMDNTDDDSKASLRKRMAFERPNHSKGDYVVDFSVYNKAAHKKINAKLLESMDIMSEFNVGFDEFTAKLNQEDMVNLGFIVSNFMYLLRAFGKNGTFVDYIRDVVTNAEASMNMNR